MRGDDMFEVKKREKINKTFRMPLDLIQKLEMIAQNKSVLLNNLGCSMLWICFKRAERRTFIMITSKIDKLGRVVIPASYRQTLGIRVSDTLIFPWKIKALQILWKCHNGRKKDLSQILHLRQILFSCAFREFGTALWLIYFFKLLTKRPIRESASVMCLTE